MTTVNFFHGKTALLSFLFLVFQVVFTTSFVPPSSSLSPFKFGINPISLEKRDHCNVKVNKIDQSGLHMVSNASNEIEKGKISAALSSDEDISRGKEEQSDSEKTPTKTKDKKIEKQLQGMKVNEKVSLGYDLEPDRVPLGQDDLMPIVETIVKAADSRKGIDIFAVRISSISSIASFAVMVTGNSKTRLNAIAEIIDKEVEDTHNLRVDVPEGNASGGWILLDYGSILVHIMTPVGREYYKLENMWKKGEKIDLSHVLKPNLPDEFRRDGNESQNEGEEVDPFWS